MKTMMMMMMAATLMVALTATAQCPAKGQKKAESKCGATVCKAEDKCDKCPCPKKASCAEAGSKKASCPNK